MENTLRIEKDTQTIIIKEVSKELINYIHRELDYAKKEIVGINYQNSLEKTEKILKNYRKLKSNIRLNEALDNKSDNLNNCKEDSRIVKFMKGYFTEEEIESNIIQTNRKYKDTKILLNYLDGVLNDYLKLKVMKDTEIRKRLILQKLYIQGLDQKTFIDNYYGKSSRMFYTDKDNLIKDLAPFFFGIAGMKVEI